MTWEGKAYSMLEYFYESRKGYHCFVPQGRKPTFNDTKYAVVTEGKFVKYIAGQDGVKLMKLHQIVHPRMRAVLRMVAFPVNLDE